MKTLLLAMIAAVATLSPGAALADKSPPELKETYISAAWCNHNGGVTEYRLPDGSRVDCLLDDYAVEHDFSKGGKPYECVGQALFYGIMTGREPLCVLIRPKGQSDEQMRHYGLRATKHGLVRVLCIDATHPVWTYRCPWDGVDTLINKP